ncbi:hypothetical protein FQN51_002951 [Onygenales sp. PD_10]|nr:hypothetical protein FQN51_002951 [Onygenales sp. PD_10]
MNPLTTPHITPNSILTTTNPNLSPADEPTLIFLIPGNPGLISYYQTFLPLLSVYLSTSDDGNNISPSCIIHGKSLGGFEIDETSEIVKSSINSKPTTGNIQKNQPGNEEEPSTQQKTGRYSLSQQIEHVERNLLDYVDAWRRPNPQEGIAAGKRRKPKVILMGHSIGSYIAMEIMRRHREDETANHQGEGEGDGGGMDIIGAVLLFPTVIDIAKSASGRKLTTLLYIPYLALLASVLAKCLTSILSGPILHKVVRFVMGSGTPEDAVSTTASFLQSKHGVEQAISMSADEMREVTADKWSDEIWGIASSSYSGLDSPSPSPSPSQPPSSSATPTPENPPLSLVLYFAQSDHWVADQTRDEIIRARGARSEKGNGNGPKMMVCEDGVVHGFCIKKDRATEE